MLHIFWIHSHITWLVTKGIIEKYGLDKAHIRLLLVRNYHSEDILFGDLESLEVDSIYLYKGIRNLKETKLAIKCFEDDFLNFTENKDFKFYIPQSKIDKVSILINLKTCQSFHYIEEGTASYMESYITELESSKTKLRRALFGLKALETSLDRNYFLPKHPKLESYFVSNKEAFTFVDKAKVINLHLFDKYLKNTPSEFDYIIAFDALAVFGMLSMDDFTTLIKTVLFPFLHTEKAQCIAFKFHPSQSETERKQLLELIENQTLTFKELPNSFVLESYLMTHKVNIINMVSSVGLYAVLSGNKVFSLKKQATVLMKAHDRSLGKVPLENQWIQL